jgi:hypothetical protein
VSRLPEHLEKQFNEQAALARAEFEANWQRWTVRDVAVWCQKWVRMDGTNYDRVVKILIDVTGVTPPGVRRLDD